MKIIISPHADDEYLSLHQHIKNWKKSKEIIYNITVYSGTRKRADDSKRYSELMDIRWNGLGFDEDNDKLDHNYNFYIEEIAFSVINLDQHNLEFYLPLGIQHPQHKKVRNIFESKINNDNIFYYIEIPYYTKYKNSEEVIQLIDNKQIKSILFPSIDKKDEKYSKCFKDQSKFFFYNKPENFYRISEIILK